MSEEATVNAEENQFDEEAQGDQEQKTAPAMVQMTQKDLDALLAREAAKVKRRAKRELESQMAQQEQKPEVTAPPAQNEMLEKMAASIDELRERIASKEDEMEFQKQVAGMELSDDQLFIAKQLTSEGREKYLSDLRKASEAPEPKGPGYQSPGAPSPIPEADRLSDPNKWSVDDINRMRSEGTFLKNIEKYRQSLPGGRSGLFPAKNPGRR